MTRHLLRDDDLAPDEQRAVLDLARRMKVDRHGFRPLEGPRSVAVIFDKPTLRTQLSFDVGIAELGGYPFQLDGRLAQIGERESVHDVAHVLGRQVAAVVWRTYGQERLEEMAQHAGVPVINALTDQFHPCQVLADLLTVHEHRGDPAGQVLTYLGDGANNMAHSYLLGGATAGMHVRVCSPQSHRPDDAVVRRAAEIAAATGGSVEVVTDPAVGVRDADVLATDTWVSMGQEAEVDSRRGAAGPFAAYRVDEQLLAGAGQDAVVLHCLPAYRGHEITAEVIDGPRSLVWDEAENRLHAQKAVLHFLLERSR